MQTNSFILDSRSGYFISEKHRQIAEIIKDYDPTLELAWIPPDKRSATALPFALVHRPVGKESYIVRKLRDDEVDERLLAWIWSNDTERNNPLLMLEKWETAKEAVRLKQQIEEAEERTDIATAILKSPLNAYKHNGKVYK